jgi:hypothetical protein
LIDKSLVIADEHHGVARYRLLETICQYARDRLDEAGETDRTRDRHLSYFLQLAEESEPELRGPRDHAVLGRLEVEHDNLRVALDWSLSSPGCGDAALRLTGAMAWFWWLRSCYGEALRWLARALDTTRDRSPARMKALYGAGWLVHHRRDSAGALELLAESLAIARELDDRWTTAFVLHHLGRLAYFDNDCALARSFAVPMKAPGVIVLDNGLAHFVGSRCDSLQDRPRSGRPLAIQPTTRALVVALACERPADRLRRH